MIESDSEREPAALSLQSSTALLLPATFRALSNLATLNASHLSAQERKDPSKLFGWVNRSAGSDENCAGIDEGIQDLEVTEVVPTKQAIEVRDNHSGNLGALNLFEKLKEARVTQYSAAGHSLQLEPFRDL